MLLIAHAAHWALSLLQVSPLLAVLAVLAWRLAWPTGARVVAPADV